MRVRLPALFLIAVSACGPSPIPGSTDGADEGKHETTDESGATGDPVTESETSSNETFVPKQDHSPDTSCDPWMQDCPEGEKCVPYASSGNNWDANKCVPVTGDQTHGEPCIYGGVQEGTDDCDATGMCWYTNEVDGELVGSCVPFCWGSADTPECPEGHWCPISGDGSLNICLPRCDPLAQDCDDGFGCYWTGGNFTCAATLEDIPLGEPCGFINDCAAGLICLNAEAFPECDGSACCGQYCDLGLGDAQCQAVPGTSCVPFFEVGSAPPEYELVGVCVLP